MHARMPHTRHMRNSTTNRRLHFFASVTRPQNYILLGTHSVASVPRAVLAAFAVLGFLKIKIPCELKSRFLDFPFSFFKKSQDSQDSQDRIGASEC